MPLTPEQAALISRLTLSTLKNEHETTLKVIRAIPESKCNYRPDDISRSALDLAWHTVFAENLFLDAVASGRFSQANGSRPNEVRTPAEVAGVYAAQFTFNQERLRKSSGEDLLKVLDFRGAFQLPAFTYLNFAIHHSIHHRGQLTMYLRPMGAPVPSIYGESYDDAKKRTDAE